ncbi:MAG: hypothetical protein ACK5A1_19430, partial [Planctomyces sp.]
MKSTRDRLIHRGFYKNIAVKILPALNAISFATIFQKNFFFATNQTSLFGVAHCVPAPLPVRLPANPEPISLASLLPKNYRCRSTRGSKKRHFCSPKTPQGFDAAEFPADNLPQPQHSDNTGPVIHNCDHIPNRSKTESSRRHSSGSAMSTPSSP